MSTLLCLFQLPKVIVKEICKVRQQYFKNIASSVGFQWLWHPQTWEDYIAIHIQASKQTHPWLQIKLIITLVCTMYSISKFLPVSVKCALYPNSCPCLWSVLYSNLAFVCALCTTFTVTDNLSASSEHADNGAALLLRVLFFFFFSEAVQWRGSLKYGASIKQSEHDLET